MSATASAKRNPDMKVIRPTKLGVFPYLPDGVHNVALSNATQYRIAITSTPHPLGLGSGKFIAVESKGAYEFQSFAHWTYTLEKLRLAPFDGDARNLSDFINCQLGIPFSTTLPSQGSYNESLCSDRT